MTDPAKESVTRPPPELSKANPTGGPGRVEIRIDGTCVEVSPELEAAVRRAYERRVQPLPGEMTTTRAAEFLDVSRPFVIKLVERGELPCRMVGKHRRIPTDALLDYREKMFRQARHATDEMAQTSQELGLYEGEQPSPRRE
jgi:excisionase family DNA binding protein